MKCGLILAASLAITGCATLTEDAMTPIALSFSDGSSEHCNLSNKRGAWAATIPSTTSVRKSDDPLRYDCMSEDNRKAFGSIPSEMGGKIIASAVFIDFGITDAITDKHRRYASSYVIPLQRSVSVSAPISNESAASAANSGTALSSSATQIAPTAHLDIHSPAGRAQQFSNKMGCGAVSPDPAASGRSVYLALCPSGATTRIDCSGLGCTSSFP